MGKYPCVWGKDYDRWIPTQNLSQTNLFYVLDLGNEASLSSAKVTEL